MNLVRKEKKIKIIMLNNRDFKGLEANAPMLWNVQWDWPEKELTDSTAKIYFIMAGLTVLSPAIPKTEEWIETSKFSRTLKLLKKKQP